jgi:type II secretory pathway component GspD/PulD (secretin)
MRTRRRVCSTSLLLGLLAGVAVPAGAAAPRPFTFENVDIQTVVKEVAALTGMTFVFDPEQVKGTITLLGPAGGVSPAEALELLRAALGLHGYALLSRQTRAWIVPAEQTAAAAFVIRVVPLTYAQADEVAYALSWIAPPSVRVVPYPPTNSVLIAGHPDLVAELTGVIGAPPAAPGPTRGPGPRPAARPPQNVDGWGILR